MSELDDLRAGLGYLSGLIEGRSSLTPAKWKAQKLITLPLLVRGWQFLAGESHDLSELVELAYAEIERLIPFHYEPKETRGLGKNTAAVNQQIKLKINSGAKLKPSIRKVFLTASRHVRRHQRHRENKRKEAEREEKEIIALQSPRLEPRQRATLDPPNFLAFI